MPLRQPWMYIKHQCCPRKCESGGFVVSTPVAITTDFDNDGDSPTGYPVNESNFPNAPDIGADEIGGIPTIYRTGNNLYSVREHQQYKQPDINGYNYWRYRCSYCRIRSARALLEKELRFLSAGTGSMGQRINLILLLLVQGPLLVMLSRTILLHRILFLVRIPAHFLLSEQADIQLHLRGCSTPQPRLLHTQYWQTSQVFSMLGQERTYTTLTAAIADINAKYIGGPVTLLLDRSHINGETCPMTLNPTRDPVQQTAWRSGRMTGILHLSPIPSQHQASYPEWIWLPDQSTGQIMEAAAGSYFR